jgi:ketosteroid isomerase-like protein
MSKNSELLLAGYEAWGRNDRDAWLQLLHPDVEIRTSGVFPDLDLMYRRHERAAQFWRELREPWDAFRIDVEHLEEEGDTVTSQIRFRARGVDSGVEVDMRFASAIRIRDDLATELVTRRTVEEIPEALRQKSTAAPRERP